MPEAHAGVEQCTLLCWLDDEGDSVKRGQDIAIIELPDRSRFGLRLHEQGIIEAILAAEGATVPVGALLLRLTPGRAGHGHVHPQIDLVERYRGEAVVDDMSRQESDVLDDRDWISGGNPA